MFVYSRGAPLRSPSGLGWVCPRNPQVPLSSNIGVHPCGPLIPTYSFWSAAKVDKHADGMERTCLSSFAYSCHSERQRRISRVGHRDSSPALGMTMAADSSFFATCAESAICWNQCPCGRPVEVALLRSPSYLP